MSNHHKERTVNEARDKNVCRVCGMGVVVDCTWHLPLERDVLVVDGKDFAHLQCLGLERQGTGVVLGPLNVRKTVQAIGVLFRTDGVQRMNYTSACPLGMHIFAANAMTSP